MIKFEDLSDSIKKKLKAYINKTYNSTKDYLDKNFLDKIYKDDLLARYWKLELAIFFVKNNYNFDKKVSNDNFDFFVYY